MAFKKQTNNSFFGDFLYENIIPKNHFLKIAREKINWDRFTKKLLKNYKGRAEVGRSPYNPSILLRMLFVSYLYNISERQLEESVNFNLPVKYFVGLGVDEKSPDHSTLTYFKDRILKNGSLTLDKIFVELINQAKKTGIEFGEIQIVDATHTGADVNTGRDNSRRKKNKERVDKDAKWGVKHSKKEENDKGKTVIQKQCFLGYKTHASLNEKTGIVTSIRVSSGNKYDGNYLSSLVKKDQNKKLINAKKLKKLNKEGVKIIYAADRGYDNGDNHTFLEEKNLGDAIKIKNIRLSKKDKNKNIWLNLVGSNDYQKGLKARYKIERKFGECKRHHGFGRTRYKGLLKYNLQANFTFMALNLKEILKSIAGIRLKSEPIT